MRIEVTYPAGISEDDGMVVSNAISSITGKGWYECQDEGERNESDGGFTHWLIVRHLGGPYI